MRASRFRSAFAPTFIVTAMVLVSACSTESPDTSAVMCGVGRTLTSARTMVAAALQAEQSGHNSAAQQMATNARSLAEGANTQLQAIADIADGQEVWASLSKAYGHVAQGANALLPGFENTHGVTGDELNGAAASLRRAQAILGDSCSFAAGVRLEGLSPPT